MDIIINNKKIVVESAKWRIEHIEHYPLSPLYGKLEFDLDYVDIIVDKHLINNLLYIILEKKEYKIEFDGKVANFYIIPDNLSRLFFELKDDKVKKINIEFVGTNNEIGD